MALARLASTSGTEPSARGIDSSFQVDVVGEILPSLRGHGAAGVGLDVQPNHLRGAHGRSRTTLGILPCPVGQLGALDTRPVALGERSQIFFSHEGSRPRRVEAGKCQAAARRLGRDIVSRR